MKIRRLNFGILLMVVFVFCRQSEAAPLMSDIMNECERVTKTFSEYTQCVKNIYDGEGANPEDPVVRWFYYQLDEISEKISKKEISQTKAMAETYKAYTETVRSNTRHNRW